MTHVVDMSAGPSTCLSCVQGVSEELLLDINREATRRMTALVAPQASEAHGPAMLRLSMGQLFEEVCRLLQKRQIAKLSQRHCACAKRVLCGWVDSPTGGTVLI